MGWGKLAFSAAGFLAGTVGVSILSSDEAKKVYTCCTAAYFRGKDKVLEVTDTIRENCDDIVADAEEIQAKHKAEIKAKEVEKAKAVLAAAEEECKAAEQAAKDAGAEPAGAAV